jgi:hypothetical protein
MRLLLVIAMMASMLFAATAAYALGGGGHHGDGRRDFSRPANAVPQAVNRQDNNPGNPKRLAGAHSIYTRAHNSTPSRNRNLLDHRVHC